MRFHPRIAPIKVGVFPLLNKRERPLRKRAQFRLRSGWISYFVKNRGEVERALGQTQIA